MRYLIILLITLVSGLQAQAQVAEGYKDVVERYPDAKLVTVRLPRVTTQLQPDTSSAVATVYKGEQLLAYQKRGEYFAVASRTKGPIGYLPENATVEGAELKDPSTATLLSVFVTGLGHMYAGEPGMGVALLGVGVGAPAAGFALSSWELGCDRYGCEVEQNLSPLYVGSAVGLVAWVIGVADAGDAASEHNEQLGITLAPTREQPGLAVRVDL